MTVKIPVADAHTHTNPVHGLGAERIAERFRSAGGWFMAIVALAPWAYEIEFNGIESYEKVVEDILIRECKAASDAGLQVACLAGFHPADVDKIIDKYRWDPSRVLDLGLRVVERMAEYCKDGVLDGIGEVGRQHYKTRAERAVISNMILEHALEYARDYGCLVHMHLEQAGRVTVDLVDRIAERIGLRGNARVKTVFHHAKPGIAVEAVRRGYSATIPGTPKLLDNVLGRFDPVFMLESDHIDDPMRPGIVVYPWVMAEHIQKLAIRMSEDYLYKINVDNIVKVYGVQPP